MFTGIIEETGTVKNLRKDKGNLVLTIEAAMAGQLKLNASVAHNGVCLSVKPVSQKLYEVTAIQETLNKTNLNSLKIGSRINLERSLKANGRIDGHFVLGHIDTTLLCTAVKKIKGSYLFTFTYTKKDGRYIVQKGSIALNGISLTVADINNSHFSVALIPYTFAHTNFKNIRAGYAVNAEYDILGKYIAK